MTRKEGDVLGCAGGDRTGSVAMLIALLVFAHGQRKGSSHLGTPARMATRTAHAAGGAPFTVNSATACARRHTGAYNCTQPYWLLHGLA